MPYRPTRKELLELIESIEVGGGDATSLRRELEAFGPEVKRVAPTRRGARVKEEEISTAERLNNRVGALFSDGINDELLDRLIDMDRSYSLKDLRTMCVEAGLGTSGDKKELAAKLVAKGILG